MGFVSVVVEAHFLPFGDRPPAARTVDHRLSVTHDRELSCQGRSVTCVRHDVVLNLGARLQPHLLKLDLLDARNVGRELGQDLE